MEVLSEHGPTVVLAGFVIMQLLDRLMRRSENGNGNGNGSGHHWTWLRLTIDREIGPRQKRIAERMGRIEHTMAQIGRTQESQAGVLRSISRTLGARGGED